MRQRSDELFLAIAHPARRLVLEMLVEADEVPVSAIQDRCGLGASALSQHLRVLKDAGLVVDERRGRTVVYRLTPEPLMEVVAWMLRFRDLWQGRLDALGAYLDQPERGDTK